MEFRIAFSQALRTARITQGLTQEDFSVVSSRTYISTLERGQKSPTLDKVHLLSQAIGMHGLSLLTLAYLYYESGSSLETLFTRVTQDLKNLQQ
jgi:transcriptional regulator with XRE-family HTH domain